MKNKLTLSVVAACLSLGLSAAPVLAQPPSPKPRPTLIPGRMRACEARSTAVQTQLAQLIRMASNMLEVFDSHVVKIKDFYTTVVVPSGKTVSNYDALVATITTKRQAVVDAWTAAGTNANAFSCTTGDPKMLLQDFRADMQATKKALKEYRTAIKNLLVAVHRVAPTPAPSPSPSPTVSPSPSPSPSPAI